MEKLDRCLGCESSPDFFFVLWLHAVRGSAEVKSLSIPCCYSCAEPGSRTYEQFRQRLGTVLFMKKNDLHFLVTGSGNHGIKPEPAASTVPDAKTKAAGGDL